MIEKKQNPWLFRFDPQFPIRVFMEEQNQISLHTHEAMEIVFIIGGSSEHLCDVEPIREIRRGDILIIPPGIAHGYNNSKDFMLINLLFDSSNLPIPFLELSQNPGYKQIFLHNAEYFRSNQFFPHFRLSEAEFAPIENLLKQFIQTENMIDTGRQVAKMGFLMVILSMLCEYYYRLHPIEQKIPLDMVKAIRYLNKNFVKALYLSDLAKMCNMSQNTFLRYFKRNVGKSPMQYILELRLQYAATLLLDSSLPINEIAEKTGMSNLTYFCRIFRRFYGMSPGNYRLQKGRKSV